MARQQKKLNPEKLKHAILPAKAAVDKSARGIRYTPQFQNKVAKEVLRHNEKNGRGGYLHCQKKYELPYLTVRRWTEQYQEAKAS